VSVEAVARLVVATGWGAHLAQWLGMIIARRGRVAYRGEWLRELAIRAAMVAVITMALRAASTTVSARAAGVGLALFVGGTVVAMLGRLALGPAWGIGVRPHGAERARTSGGAIYGSIRHPIYVGTTLASAGQWLALGNAWSLALFVGAAIVGPLKAVRERAWLRRQASEAARGAANRRA
jgi:protein-S-isoprenylcysteine O-methyltransferase Ste14